MSGKPKYTAFTIVYLAQMETELQQMRDTLAGGLLWDDISAASFEVTSALLGKINAELQRMRGTLSRGPLWDDINAAYFAVSSALRQIEADFKRVAIFRDIKNEVPSDFGSEKSAARARPASATPRYFATLASRHGYHNDSTPVRLPYVLSPPALGLQTPTKHPALRLRGGRRTSCAPSKSPTRAINRSPSPCRCATIPARW